MPFAARARKGNDVDFRAPVFRDERGKTALTLQLRVISTTARAPQYLKGMGIGWEQSLERLGAHLAATATAEVIGIVAGERAIVGTRVFDAPREVVWKMWTDPAHVAQWWGPNGFRTTIREMNVKPGGIWRQVMHGPDGRDYHNHLVFIEVSEPERLVYEHRPVEGAEPVSFRTTVTLSAQGERTQVSVEMVFPSTAERDRIAKTYGAVEGLTQHLARLAERLKKA